VPRAERPGSFERRDAATPGQPQSARDLQIAARAIMIAEFESNLLSNNFKSGLYVTSLAAKVMSHELGVRERLGECIHITMGGHLQ
jgi:hypothetical protein